MARDTGPQCKRCRREGVALYLKGSRCSTVKCGVVKREYPPGEHAWRRGKFSEYGHQLREKQKLKRYYGVSERQFRRYFDKASRMKGNTGENLLVLLESRLDNVLFRLGMARSHNEARQMVSHGHVYVNGKRLNIPSALLRKNDAIAPEKGERFRSLIKTNMESTKELEQPSWLQMNAEGMEGIMLDTPKRAEALLAVQEQLIVEFCSK
jgi:small subunit ribosomal protein S4